MTSPLATSQARILVVAGDRTATRRLSWMLQESGYVDVVGTSSPAKAVKLCQTTRPNLVILDTCLDGASGYDVAEQLYDGFAPSEAPNFLMVAIDGEEVPRIQAQMLNGAGVLVQPFAAEDLTREVKAALVSAAR